MITFTFILAFIMGIAAGAAAVNVLWLDKQNQDAELVRQAEAERNYYRTRVSALELRLVNVGRELAHTKRLKTIDFWKEAVDPFTDETEVLDGGE